MPDIWMQFTPPPADLSDQVLGFAERIDDGACLHAVELPIPNPMIQFMLGGDYLVADEAAPRAALWGPTSSASNARTTGPARVFMVVLTAAGAVRLGRTAFADLMDRRVPLEAIDGRSGFTIARRITEATDFPTRCGIATSWLRDGLGQPGPALPMALIMADQITRHELRAPVARLAEHAGMTPRALHKAFDRHVGCSPKALLRLARLQRVLRTLHPRPWSPLPSEDAVLEFTDMAHLDRDFRDLTGLSRASYVAAKRRAGDGLVHTVV